MQVYTFVASIQGESERIRVWVDNSMVVDLWSSLFATEANGNAVFLSSNTFYEIIVEYKQEAAFSFSSVRLSWISNMVRQTIPHSNYFVSNSLFSTNIFVSPASTCGTSSTLVGIGLTLATAGQQSSFRVELKDEYSNLRFCGSDELILDGSLRILTRPELCINGTHIINYLALDKAGVDHSLVIRMDPKSAGWRYRLNVEPGEVNESVSVLNGASYSISTAGLWATFYIVPKDSFGSVIYSPSLRFMIDMNDTILYKVSPYQPGLYSVQYQITVSGPYQLSLLTPKAAGLFLRRWAAVDGSLVEPPLVSISTEGPNFSGALSESVGSTSPFVAQWDGLIWPPMAQTFFLVAEVADCEDRLELWIDQSCVINQWNSLAGVRLSQSFHFHHVGGFEFSLKYKHNSKNQASIVLWWSSDFPQVFDFRPIDNVFFSEIPQSSTKQLELWVAPGYANIFTISPAVFCIATVGTQASFNILARDAWGNFAGDSFDIAVQLSSDLSSAPSIQAYVVPIGRAMYSVRMPIPTIAGDYKMHITTLYSGVTASYYSDLQFTLPLISSTAPNIDFSSIRGLRPNLSFPAGSVSGIRWIGFVRAEVAQLHTFSIGFQSVSERVRLWIDNSIIIDQWSSISYTMLSGMFRLGTAHSYYSIRLDYKQLNSTHDSGLMLSWSSGSSGHFSVISSNYMYCQFLSEPATLPVSVLPGKFCASSSSHTFSAFGMHTVPFISTFDIAMRDSYGNLLDGLNWPVPITVRSVTIDGSAVSVATVTQFSSSGLIVTLTITKTGLYRIMIAGVSGNGLVSAYYSDRDCRNVEMANIIISSNFTWDSNSYENFRQQDILCLRWSGYLYVSASDNYTFQLNADEDVSLYLNDVPVGPFHSTFDRGPRRNLEIFAFLDHGIVPIRVICRSSTGIRHCSVAWRRLEQESATLLFGNIYPELVLLNTGQSPPPLRATSGPCFAPLSSGTGNTLSLIYSGYSVSFTIKCRDSYGNPTTYGSSEFFFFATANSFRKRAIHFPNSLANLDNGDIIASFVLSTQVCVHSDHFF